MPCFTFASFGTLLSAAKLHIHIISMICIYIFTLYRIDIDITVNSVISRLFMLVSLFDLSRLLVSSCLVPALLDMHAEDYSKENAPLRL